MIHRVYLRLPATASYGLGGTDSICIECPAEQLNELCKWMRLTADSLDGKLSASELGYLQDALEPAARSKAFVEAVEECQNYSKSARTEEAKAVAMNIAVRIAQRAKRK